MEIESTRFGTIEVPDDRIYDIEVHGFSGDCAWALIDDEIGKPFMWLQSTSIDALAFIVIDPSDIIPKYHFSVKKSDLKDLGAVKVDDLQVYCIVNMAPNILDVNVNLAGPLVIHKETRKGKQIIVPDQNVRVPLFTKDEGLEDQVKQENMQASARNVALDMYKGRR